MSEKREIGLIFAFIVLVGISLTFVSSTVSIGNLSHDIETSYGPSQGIVGWINMSVKNEDVNSLLTDSLSNSVSLLDLLRQNSGLNYSCSPQNCGDDYQAGTGATQVSIHDANSSKIYGILFTGNVSQIDSISFNVVASGIPTSCTNQFKIDLFNNGSTDFSNNLSSSELCPGTKTYGCYSASIPTQEKVVDSSPYCQRMTLPEAPGFVLGAWLKNISGARTAKMTLYDMTGSLVSGVNCILPSPTASGGEVSCSVNYTVTKPQDYYVCLSASGTGEYRTKGYATASGGCGFAGQPIQAEVAAYDIFAQARQFGSFSSISVTNIMPNGDRISDLANAYLIDKYGSLNCASGCVIPIQFTSNFADDFPFSLSIQSIKAEYEEAGHTISNNIYDLAVAPAKVNLNYGKLYLDNSNLKVRSSYGNFTYNLRFNDSKLIFSQVLTVQKTPTIKGITPTSTAYAFPTTFQLNVDQPGNISSYKWNFGDNTSAQTTTMSNITHTYNSSGIYNLSIVITDKTGITSSGEFPITVTSPAALINTTLKSMALNIANVKNAISKFDLFYQSGLEEIFNTTYLSTQVAAIQTEYNGANESQYPQIISEILSLNIPETVSITKTTNNFAFYPQQSDVNLDVLQAIGGGNFTNTADYQNAISAWNIENMKTNVTFNEFSAKYGNTSVPMMRTFTFKISQNTSLNYNPYFIIRNIGNLDFKGNYEQKSTEGYTYIELTPGDKEITFSTNDSVSYDNLPAFIAPPLSRLSLEGIENNTPEPPAPFQFNWQWFGIAIAGLLVIGLILYVVLQIWYKKRYEGFLFKNKNDLYNLFSFIETQRRNGISEMDISSKLRKAGWNPEQIRYSMRKHSGKSTGMFEIPIGRLFEKFGNRQ